MFDLTDKTALVTGASGGIGGAIARALHARGAAVTLSGTRTGPLEALAAELAERVHVLPCDLSDAAAVEALAKKAADLMDGVGILVNNAGITRDGLFMRMSDADWLTVLDVNLTSTMRLCRGVLRGMMKARAGRIINISSVVGVTGNPGQANYAASKAGVIGYVRRLADELDGRGITVNAIAPGFIETRLTAAIPVMIREVGRRLSSLGQGGLPRDIGDAITFLATPGAQGLTGNVLRVCGQSFVGA
jgi:3-oxoacyl-[acyl-carrier protein] reductase